MDNISFHPTALVQSSRIGSGTRVWAFVNILPKAIIGSECNICDHVFIENDVVVGDRVTVKPGVQLWDGVRLEDDVFVGPNATFSNDNFPRSRQYPDSFCKTIIKQGASIGANATILSDLTVGKNAMVGAGSVVTRSVPANAIVVGNPARIVGYVDTPTSTPANTPEVREPTSISVAGVSVSQLSHIVDLRGDLCVAELEKDLPFQPKRIFFVYNVPYSRVRGEHAHKQCHQYMIAVKGSVSIVVDDGKDREECLLDQPSLGLHLPPRIWGIQYKYSPEAILMVLASHEYDPDDYIRDYDEFLNFIAK